MTADLPQHRFADAAAFSAWVAAQPADSPGLWVSFAKKGNPEPSVTKAEAIEVALCHGWIDGQLRPLDDLWFLTRFTPRRARSIWSQKNCAAVETLTAAGRMQPAGLAQVEAAKADGRWDAAYAGSSTIEVHPDFQAALDADPAALQAFSALDRTNRFAFCFRVGQARKPETRARRIAEFVAMLARGEVLHEVRQPKPRS